MSTLLGNTETAGIMPGKGLVNPIFQIKITTPNDKLQQPKTANTLVQVDDYLDKIKAGDRIKFKDNDGTISGRVESIEKNPEGDGLFVHVIDDNGEKHKVEGSRVISAEGIIDPLDKANLTSSPAMFAENSKFLSYDEFHNV